MTGHSRVDPRIIKARASLLLRHPFWGSLALYLQPVEDLEADTMWTDGEKLGYNPAFLDSLSEKELQGVLAHEVSHCAYRHHTRQGKRSDELWNMAADYAINRDLVAANFILPSSALLDIRFHGMSAEEIYSILEKENPPPRQSQAGASADPGGCGGIRQAGKPSEPDKLSKASADWEIRVRQAISAERGSKAGELPADLVRMFEQIQKPQTDWREILQLFLQDGSRIDYSWMRPNKRLLHTGFILPGTIKEGVNHIVFAIDTSGSINQKALNRSVAELQLALDTGIVDKITVLSCDTQVYNPRMFEIGEEISYQPRGGGGTRFSPVFKWVEDNEPEVSGIVYFTDMECYDFGPAPERSTLWLGYGDPNRVRSYFERVPFGTCVYLND